MLDQLLYWVAERENMRKLKEGGVFWPWTSDPILQNYRFCNVRRKDDKVSRWLIDNIYRHRYEELNPAAFIQWVATFRFINWPPTIAELIGPGYQTWDDYNPTAIMTTLAARAKRGEKVWGGAYMVQADPTPGKAKHEYTIGEVIGQNLNSSLPSIVSELSSKSRESVANAISGRVNGIGSFMAGQIVDDLTWTTLLKDPYDQYGWAPIGPGSRRGFNRMLGRDLNRQPRPKEWSDHIQVWRGEIVTANPDLSDMTLHDVQNCLCEVDKYLRLKEGGRVRNTYKPYQESY